jgi:LysR family transcriptional regulator, transcriptional activator of the cysJI operon
MFWFYYALRNIKRTSLKTNWVNQLNINQLKIFYLAAKHGNLSTAAELLNITQPAVTKGIQRFQEYYGVKLVERLGKNLSLTYAGQGLYKIAEKIFEMEQTAEDYICDFQKNIRGHIRIDSSESFGNYYLPSSINQFNQSNPSIQVTVNIISNDEVMKHTASRKNDLGFISHFVKHKNLVSREVLEENLVIIVPFDHSFKDKQYLEPQDLEGQNMIMHHRETAPEPQKVMEEYVKKNDISIPNYLEFSNNELIKKAVIGGRGIALISEKAVTEEVKAGKLKILHLSDKISKRKFYMIHHKDKILSGALRNLANMVLP